MKLTSSYNSDSSINMPVKTGLLYESQWTIVLCTGDGTDNEHFAGTVVHAKSDAECKAGWTSDIFIKYLHKPFTGSVHLRQF